MRDLTFYLANTPPLQGPRLDVDIETYNYRPWLVRQRSAFAFLVLQKLNGQDRLTEVGHSIDGVFQALRGFVLSMCYSIDTTRRHVIVSEFPSYSVDAGFVLLLPLHQGDLDSVGISTKDHVAIW